MANNFEDELEDLKKEFWLFVQTMSPQIQQINNQLTTINSSISDLTDTVENLEENGSSSGNSDENWILLYDKDSNDESLNWGFPDGIDSSYRRDFPDIENYKKLKFRFNHGTLYEHSDFVFDISDISPESPNNYKLVTTSKVVSTSNMAFYTGSFTIHFDEGVDQGKLDILSIYRIVIKRNSYPEIIKNTGDFFYSQIWGVLKDGVSTSGNTESSDISESSTENSESTTEN